MDRHGIPYRNPYKRMFNFSNGICRQFMTGSCRFGPSCHYLHEWPLLTSTQICRYFQKGTCWFGDRCRYLHIPHPDGEGVWASRRGSAPALHAPVLDSRALPDRRGSEPSAIQVRGVYGPSRRGPHSVLNPVETLQHSFERLTTEIPEEEQHGIEAPSRPLREGERSRQNHEARSSHQATVENHPETSAQTTFPSSPHAAKSRASAEAAKPKETLQDGAENGGAAAPIAQIHEEDDTQSKDVTCGICMDKVCEKSSSEERRFGILPNCNHAFCLGCIVTWRKTKDFQEDVIKACPQCRVKSSYYIPSKHWVSDGEPKKALIAAFKEKCSKRRCNFFMQHGCCPFETECIYWHELPRGYRPRRRRLAPTHHSRTLEDLDIDDVVQLLDYVIAVTQLEDLLDEGEEDDRFQFYMDDYYDPL